MENDMENNRKRPGNCFRCWHCRRVDGTSKCCICVANVTKKYPPDIVYEPYKGTCLQFYDKMIVESECLKQVGESENNEVNEEEKSPE